MANCHRQAADLHADRQPRTRNLSSDAIPVKDICDHYLAWPFRRVEAGEITDSRFHDCRRTIEDFAMFAGRTRVVDDLGPDDFEAYRQKLFRKGLLAGRPLGVHALDRSVGVVRAVFDHAYENDLLAGPVKIGTGFRGSSASAKRTSRSKNQVQHGKKLFSSDAILKMLQLASTLMRAMILLAVNGGMGNKDCGRLPLKVVHFEKALVEYPRPKTGIDRVVPLWPETAEALCEVVARRPKAKDPDARGLVFVTKFGRAWYRHDKCTYDQGNISQGTRTHHRLTPARPCRPAFACTGHGRAGEASAWAFLLDISRMK